MYVYDNTPGGMSIDSLTLLSAKNNLKVLSNGKNDGLSKAFQKFHELSSNKYDFLCLLDQDSRINTETINSIISSIESDDEHGIAIYAPRIKYSHKERENSLNGYSYSDWVISSGSFIKNIALHEVGGFDAYYFIDRLDVDLCYCITKLGMKIKILNHIKLYQKLGEFSKILGFNFYQHSPFRNYHISKSRLYFYTKHKDRFILPTMRIILGTIMQVLKVSFMENNKLRKIKMIAKGIKDYLNEDLSRLK
ncbi:hypothetical protein AB4304_14415 [Vibrio breoganii]|uniref:hypothetical protein n=1 Tax=Vibrio breoganii TaxID=553239 RepID=UPI001054DB7B|nr:hypothetical protein [Vibrio breoganii]